MKYSIIVPVYNAENSLLSCVNSILDQNYPFLELILVEDYSTDNSLAICLELQERNKQVRCIQTKGKGVSDARNTGLNLATGDIIGFCDSDDSLVECSLQIIANAFEKYPDASIVVTGFNYTQMDKADIVRHHYESNNRITMWSSNKLQQKILYDNKIKGSVCNKYFRKNILHDSLRFRSKLSFCEDTHFLMCLLNKNSDIKVLRLRVSIYNYQYNSNSATNSAEGLFGQTGQLKYIDSMQCIQDDCKLDKYSDSLVNRAKFVLAQEVFVGFNLSHSQYVELLRIMRINFFHYFAHPLLENPISFLKRLIKLLVKIIKTMIFSRKT